MKLPRDISGNQLIKALERLDYHMARQTGSHVRLECAVPEKHLLTIPLHNPLRVGTLSAILNNVGKHHALTREALIIRLFGKN
ncbi:MAG TPA: hypothetical protein DEO56_00250 [Nitrosomonas nitrosa]|nr:hypothetical protein [Nitrosomonas nitrosa]HNP52219.1 type II toxin-antitoxin system HicA family toxin [Nitrosomonas nitrosa]